MSDFELPPIFPDVGDQLENYLLRPENLPIHKYERNQQFWGREADPLELLDYGGAPVSTTLRVCIITLSRSTIQLEQSRCNATWIVAKLWSLEKCQSIQWELLHAIPCL